MEIVEYDEKYLPGIIACFKRNYAVMKGLEDNTIKRWMEPLISYSWNGSEKSGQHYKHGMVLLNDRSVIGYCGLFFSTMYIDGKEYKYVNPSTWAIDHEYSFFVFQAMNKMLELADIVGDFTPSEKVKKMSIEMYDFKYLDKEKYMFIPFPSFSNKLEKKVILSPEDIVEASTRIKMIDHIKYGVKCAVFEDKHERTYIFYKKIFSKIKGIKRVPFVIVLEITNEELFHAHTHEIVWFLQHKECSLVECDGRFIKRSLKVGGLKRITSNKRIVYSDRLEMGTDPNDAELLGNPSLSKISLLYSELATLEQVQYL